MEKRSRGQARRRRKSEQRGCCDCEKRDGQATSRMFTIGAKRRATETLGQAMIHARYGSGAGRVTASLVDRRTWITAGPETRGLDDWPPSASGGSIKEWSCRWMPAEPG